MPQAMASATKPPRIIAEHFDLSSYKQDDNGCVEADCAHCSSTIKGQKNVTSNFIQHMRRRHPDAYGRFAASGTQRVKRPRLARGGIVRDRVELGKGGLVERAVVSPVHECIVRTPCEAAPSISAKCGVSVSFKREDRQLGGGVVFRGAVGLVLGGVGGVVGFGSTAAIVERAASVAGRPCVRVEDEGEARDKARDIGALLVDVAGAVVPPGCDDAAAGYATLALEIVQQVPAADVLFIAGGNALLLQGFAAVIARLGRAVRVVAVVLEGTDGAGEAAQNGNVALDDTAAVAVPAVAGAPDAVVPVAPMEDDGGVGCWWRSFATDVVTVTRAEMCAAVKTVFEDADGALLKPEGVLSVAGAVKYARERQTAQERFVCVVTDRLSSFDALRMVSTEAARADGSQCLLSVEQSDERGSSTTLAELMKELRGTAGGQARVTHLQYAGRWPFLLGLSCDETTTAAAHVANLTSLGYTATDVTLAGIADSELDLWSSSIPVAMPPVPSSDTPSPASRVLRVELAESTSAVVGFLSEVRAEAPFTAVSYRYDGGSLARLLVRAVAPAWRLSLLEAEIRLVAHAVTPVPDVVAGLRVLGGITLSEMPVEETPTIVADSSGAAAETATLPEPGQEQEVGQEREVGQEQEPAVAPVPEPVPGPKAETEAVTIIIDA